MRARRAAGLFLGMLAYYAAIAAIARLVAHSVPSWGPLFSDRTPAAATIAMFGALALTIPVAALYMRTKPKANYDSSLVQTVIVLPIVISGVVLIVRDSVAVAFSLAGIVAAVRFRNTLKDTKDAVYIFLAIAVGLAAGMQSFAVGFVVSLMYVVVILVLWRFDVGTAPMSDRVEGRLIVETSRPAATQSQIDGVLERHARRWKLIQSAPTSLTFDVQLRRRSDPETLLTAVRAEPALEATGVRFEPRDA